MTREELKYRASSPIFILAMLMFILGMINAWRDYQIRQHNQIMHEKLDTMIEKIEAK